MALKRKRSFDSNVTIDGQLVRLKLKRMGVDEFEVFNAKFLAMSKGRGKPSTSASDEPSAAATRALLREEADYLKENAEWVSSVFKDYVTVVEGDVVDELEDGTEKVVTCGAEFAAMFSGQIAVLSDVLGDLWLSNKLTEDQKKELLLRLASDTGSTTASSPEAPGPTPATTATAAGPEASVPVEAAMELSSPA